MLRKLLIPFLLLAACLAPLSVGADRATVLRIGTKTYVIAYTSAGTFYITDVTEHKLDEVKPNPQVGLAEKLYIIRDQRNPKLVPVLLDLMFKYQRGTKPEMSIMDKIDTSNPVVQSYLNIKERDDPNAGFPYFFLVDAAGKIVYKGPVLDSLAKNEEIIKKYQERR